RDGIDQITVVHEPNRAVAAVDDDGLSIPFVAVAGRGIAGMADGVNALESGHDILGKHIRDVAHGLMRIYLVTVGRRHSGALLASMLQGVESQVRHLRGVCMIRDPKDSTHCLLRLRYTKRSMIAGPADPVATLTRG